MQMAAESVQFSCKSNPNVRIMLEFTGDKDAAAIKEEITGVLLKQYLKKIKNGEGAFYE